MTEDEKIRLDICSSCTKTICLGKEKICSQCGCPIKSKVRVKEEKCNLNKW